jgi:type IV secretory pathway VirB10-like protein
MVGGINSDVPGMIVGQLADNVSTQRPAAIC